MLSITGARVLLPGQEQACTVTFDHDVIAAVGGDAPGRNLDASGMILAPGIIDLHGDAFERSIQPRPGVNFPLDLAVADADAQAAAAGITTVFHGITLSWEPGLRGGRMFTAMLDALDRLRPRALVEHRIHIRMEAIAPDEAPLATAAIAAGRAHMVAINDHTASIVRKANDPVANAGYSKRAGVAVADYVAQAAAMLDRRAEGHAALAEVLAAARTRGLPVASHDDDSPAIRAQWRAEGASICEFPMNEATARDARAHGESVIMGCPNVVRGGSHLGWHSAEAMVQAGLCDVLVSDYVWAAMLPAALRIAEHGVRPLHAAWGLVSTNPARAALLPDRGAIAPGQRADLVLIDPAPPAPRIAATLVAGRLAFAAHPVTARL